MNQIFLCPDRDEAGAGAYAAWRELFPAGQLALVPHMSGVSDPTELQRAALSLPVDESTPLVSEWLAGLLAESEDRRAA